MLIALMLAGCATTAGPGFSADPPLWTPAGVPLPICEDPDDHQWAFTDVAGQRVYTDVLDLDVLTVH